MIYIYLFKKNKSCARPDNMSNWEANLDACRNGSTRFLLGNLLSSEQECCTRKQVNIMQRVRTSKCTPYLWQFNKNQLSEPYLILSVCQSKHHTIAKNGIKTHHTTIQDVESNDLWKYHRKSDQQWLTKSIQYQLVVEPTHNGNQWLIVPDHKASHEPWLIRNTADLYISNYIWVFPKIEGKPPKSWILLWFSPL